MMRRAWLAGLLSAGLVGYGATWLWLQYPGGYDALLVMVRAILLAFALMCAGGLLWWAFFVRRLRVKTLVVSGPLVVGLLAVPLPYYSVGYSVQQNLKQIGVRYHVEPAGFAQTLHQFACDVLCLDWSELFASHPTWIEIDPATVRQDQLDRIHDYAYLKMVSIQKRESGSQLQPELTNWLNSLPSTVRMDIAFLISSPSDWQQLQQLNSPLATLCLSRHEMTDDAVHGALSINTSTLLFHEIKFPSSFSRASAPQSSMGSSDTLTLTRSVLTGSQLVDLVYMTGCQTLNCDWVSIDLTVEECVLLSLAPKLHTLSLGDMRLSLDHVRPLAASSQLKTFTTGDTAMTFEELQELKPIFPEGSNRRIRSQSGRSIQLGDVGRRR